MLDRKAKSNLLHHMALLLVRGFVVVNNTGHAVEFQVYTPEFRPAAYTKCTVFAKILHQQHYVLIYLSFYDRVESCSLSITAA